MLIRTLSAAVMAFLITGSNAYALLGSDACKDVTFKVDNNYGERILVKKFELYSKQEGRYLTEDFRNVEVPVGSQKFVVREGENVEYAENDDITKIRVTFSYREADGDWSDSITRIDSSITHPKCVRYKNYLATINH